MSSIKALAAAELQRRLESMSTAELLKIAAPQRRSSPPPSRSAARSGEHRVTRSSPPEGQLTVAAAVLRAVRDARGVPLSSAEIIEAATALRPGTAAPTIRAEISRLDSRGELRLAPGPDRRYRAA